MTDVAWLALAGLVLAAPGAVLSVMVILERVKRKKVEQMASEEVNDFTF